MSKTQEAIKDGCKGCPKKVCTWGGFVGDCPLNTSGKSEPALNQSGTGQEPKEFEKWFDKVFGDPNHPEIIKRRFYRLEAELSFTKQELGAANLEIKTLKNKLTYVRKRYPEIDEIEQALKGNTK